MNTDLTAAVMVNECKDRARLQNDGTVQVYRDGALVGTGHRVGNGVEAHDRTLGAAVYSALAAALTPQTAPTSEIQPTQDHWQRTNGRVRIATVIAA